MSLQQHIHKLLKGGSVEIKKEDLVSLVRQADRKSSSELIKVFSAVLTSRQRSPAAKLQAFSLFVQCMGTANADILTQAAIEIMPWLAEIAEFRKESTDPSRGRGLFGASSKIHQQASEEFLSSLLVSIENWAVCFKRIEDGFYYKLYKELKQKGVCFNLGLRPKNEHIICRKLIREITILIEFPDSTLEQVKGLVKNLKGYKISFEKEAMVEIQEWTETMEMIDECVKNFQEWKLNSCKPRQLGLLQEIKFKELSRPKRMAENREYDSMKGSDNEVEEPLANEDSLRWNSSEISNENYKLREKIAEYEDLAQMYKADLMNMQSSYLTVVEEREEAKLSNSKLRKETNILKEKAEEIRGEMIESQRKYTTATDQLIAYKSKAETIEQLLKELNDKLIGIEREARHKDKIIVDLQTKLEHKEKASIDILRMSRLRMPWESPDKIRTSSDFSIIESDKSILPPHPTVFRRAKNFSFDDRFSLWNEQIELSNKQHFESCLVNNSGVLFENQQMIIHLSLACQGNLCTAELAFTVKNDTAQCISFDFAEIPASLHVIHDFDHVSSLKNEISVSVASKIVGHFSGYPVARLTYTHENKEMVFFVGIPITQCIFFKRVEINYLEAWKKLVNHSKSVEINGNYWNYSIKYFTQKCSLNNSFIVRKIVQSSAIIYSQFEDKPILCKLTKRNYELKIEVRCIDEILASILLDLIKGQFNKNID